MSAGTCTVSAGDLPPAPRSARKIHLIQGSYSFAEEGFPLDNGGSLRPVTKLQLETHLMISDPDFFVEEFAQAGTDSFMVHWEGNNDLSRTVQRIKALGKRVGVAINPATPAEVLEEIMQDIDQVLVMTVNPGFGHQHFLHTTLPKIGRARRMIDRIKPGCDLEVDGGVDVATAPLAVAAGANVLVAGSAIFNDGEDVADAMKRLRAAAQI